VFSELNEFDEDIAFSKVKPEKQQTLKISGKMKA